jgi:hypothetical protein
MINTIRKLVRRKNKKYYEASDALTKKEKTKLWTFFSILATPVVIAIVMILIN